MDRKNGVAQNSNSDINRIEESRTTPNLSPQDSLELHFDDHRLFTELLGQHDSHIRTIEQALGVRIGVNGNSLKVTSQ
jgi:phosphate starvation-inducible protein PhoH